MSDDYGVFAATADEILIALKGLDHELTNFSHWENSLAFLPALKSTNVPAPKSPNFWRE